MDTLCLMFAFGVAGSAWAVFAARERRLRRQLTRDSETVAFNADEILHRARRWVNGHGGSGAAFLVSMDHYAEISAILRVCQSAELLGQVAARLVAMCRTMNLPVVAEGVETEAQRDILNALGCHVMQGFLLGRPVPVAGIRELAAAMS